MFFLQIQASLLKEKNCQMWLVFTMYIFFFVYFPGVVKTNKILLDRELQKQQQSLSDSERTKSEIQLHCGSFKHNSKRKYLTSEIPRNRYVRCISYNCYFERFIEVFNASL